MNKNAICWINHKIIPADQASVSVFDHGLLYGDGIFEGLRFYNNVIFMLKEHLQRLEQSARAIALKLPMDINQIESALINLVDEYPSNTGYLRLVVTRGVGNLGIDPQKCPLANLFIIADELSVVNTQHINEGISLIIASTRRTPSECLNPKIKSLNYLNNILARIEANCHGADEALMLNTAGFVSEGTVDNLFILKDQKLFTPQISDGLLEGITRGIILEIAKRVNIEVIETSLTPYDLLQADECFLSGTGAELIKVKKINQHSFNEISEPMYPVFLEQFKRVVEKECR